MPRRRCHNHVFCSVMMKESAVLTSDGKGIESFWFRFLQYNEVKLCLYFDGYQGVDLEGRMFLWCKCK
jgi:hypothetical protein